MRGDAGYDRISLFDYYPRANADDKLADLLGKKKGLHVLQMVKAPLPEAPPIG